MTPEQEAIVFAILTCAVFLMKVFITLAIVSILAVWLVFLAARIKWGTWSGWEKTPAWEIVEHLRKGTQP